MPTPPAAAAGAGLAVWLSALATFETSASTSPLSVGSRRRKAEICWSMGADGR